MSRGTRLNLERILLLILLGMVALTIVRYVNYRQHFPRPLQVGDLILQEMDREAARQRLEEIFNQPIILRYMDREVELDPKDVDFHLYVERMLDAAWGQLSTQLDATDFLAVTLGGPARPLPVSVAADYDPQALWRELEAIAAQWDRPAQPPHLLKSELRFAPGEPARKLDIEASLPRVVEALLSPTQRQADLMVTQEAKLARRDMSLLQDAIRELLADFPGVAGVFVKDLASGEELSINGEVAFAGMSLMKIAIMEEFFRRLDRPPTVEETKLLTETMTLSGNYTANLLLAEIGGGNPYRGVRRLTESMRRIGLVNTFMATPYDEDRPPPHIVTPANSRRDVNTEPDPYMQTTPLDIGLLLEMIYQGARGGGTLIAAYPGQITPEECQAMLEIMRHNYIGSLIEKGLPEGTPLAHKHGWIGDTHADAGVVLSPGGDYVLVVFLYQKGWLQWGRSAPLIAGISHVTYNYFNMDDQW